MRYAMIDALRNDGPRRRARDRHTAGSRLRPLPDPSLLHRKRRPHRLRRRAPENGHSIAIVNASLTVAPGRRDGWRIYKYDSIAECLSAMRSSPLRLWQSTLPMREKNQGGISRRAQRGSVAAKWGHLPFPALDGLRQRESHCCWMPSEVKSAAPRALPIFVCERSSDPGSLCTWSSSNVNLSLTFPIALWISGDRT